MIRRILGRRGSGGDGPAEAEAPIDGTDGIAQTIQTNRGRFMGMAPDARDLRRRANTRPERAILWGGKVFAVIGVPAPRTGRSLPEAAVASRIEHPTIDRERSPRSSTIWELST